MFLNGTGAFTLGVNMNIKAIIFDFDGVIANTEARNLMYLEKAFNYYSIQLTDAEREYVIGRNDHEFIIEILKRADKRVSLEEFINTRKSLGNSYEDGTLKLEAGLDDFLKKIKSEGILTGIGSSTSSRYILSALNTLQILPYFNTVVCGDMVKTAKPAPDIYLKVISNLKLKPSECIVIEDSSVGIASALSAGCIAIGYTGATKGQDTSKALLSFSSYKDLYSKLIAL